MIVEIGRAHLERKVSDLLRLTPNKNTAEFQRQAKQKGIEALHAETAAGDSRITSATAQMLNV